MDIGIIITYGIALQIIRKGFYQLVVWQKSQLHGEAAFGETVICGKPQFARIPSRTERLKIHHAGHQPMVAIYAVGNTRPDFGSNPYAGKRLAVGVWTAVTFLIVEIKQELRIVKELDSRLGPCRKHGTGKNH